MIWDTRIASIRIVSIVSNRIVSIRITVSK